MVYTFSSVLVHVIPLIIDILRDILRMKLARHDSAPVTFSTASKLKVDCDQRHTKCIDAYKETGQGKIFEFGCRPQLYCKRNVSTSLWEVILEGGRTSCRPVPDKTIGGSPGQQCRCITASELAAAMCSAGVGPVGIVVGTYKIAVFAVYLPLVLRDHQHEVER